MADAADPAIALWSFDFWINRQTFESGEEFITRVVEPTVSAWMLTQGGVYSRKSPAIAILQPFASGAWSLSQPGSVLTLMQGDAFGTGLIDAAHAAHLEREGARVQLGAPLGEVAVKSSGWTVNCTEDDCVRYEVTVGAEGSTPESCALTTPLCLMESHLKRDRFA